MKDSLAQYTKRTLEMTVGAEDILRVAVDRARFPSKRFRVEGSSVGTSRLLNKDNADYTQRMYGGRIVEIVTREMFLTAQAKALDLPYCDRKSCAAARGLPCKDKQGQIVNPHKKRLGVEKPDPVAAAADLPSCQQVGCLAKPGAPCTSPKGNPRMPHRKRIPKKAKPGALL